VVEVARYIDINFASRGDCLDNMVPSDLRMLVSERDGLLGQRDNMLLFIKKLVSGNDEVQNEWEALDLLTDCASDGEQLINEIEQSKQTKEGDS
jgi:hypothetical protein